MRPHEDRTERYNNILTLPVMPLVMQPRIQFAKKPTKTKQKKTRGNKQTNKKQLKEAVAVITDSNTHARNNTVILL